MQDREGETSHGWKVTGTPFMKKDSVKGGFKPVTTPTSSYVLNNAVS